MILAVASGKGGTGKTTISVNMAKAFEGEISLFDCDVEEPNSNLFLKGASVLEEIASIPIPQVDKSLCDGCGECGNFCEFKAIVSFGTAPLIFPNMCHGCGGCAKVCPKNAIQEVGHRIGAIETFKSGNVTLVQGKLDVGAPMAPPLIRAVKARLPKGKPVILDAPPGTSCPVVAALRGADLALLVTEPTPFGLHDFELAVETVRELKMPFAAVVNRVGIGDDRTHRFCRERKIPIILEIPDDRRIAEAYSKGQLIVEALPEYRNLFKGLINKALELAVSEANYDE